MVINFFNNFKISFILFLLPTHIRKFCSIFNYFSLDDYVNMIQFVDELLN